MDNYPGKLQRYFYNIDHPSGVNFTNILQAAFSYKPFCAAFMCLQFGYVIFWRKDFDTKADHKMLVKLTPGDNITIFYEQLFCTNIFCAAIMCLQFGYVIFW